MDIMLQQDVSASIGINSAFSFVFSVNDNLGCNARRLILLLASRFVCCSSVVSLVLHYLMILINLPH